MSEVDEVSIILDSVSVPVDVIVRSGCARDTLMEAVNDSSLRDETDIDNANSSFTI